MTAFMRFFLVLCILCLSPQMSWAKQEERVGPRPHAQKAKASATALKQPVDLPPLKDQNLPQPGHLYQVSLSCRPRDGLAAMNQPSFWAKFFVNQSDSASFLVLFHTDGPTGTGGQEELPKATVAAINVYSAEPGKTYDAFKACSRSFLIDGNHAMWVTPVTAASSTHKAGEIFTAVDAVAKLSTPLTTLLTGAPSDLLPGFNTQIQAMKGPMDTLFGMLDTSFRSVNPFRVFLGKTTINAPVGTIDITVTPVDSIVALSEQSPDLLGDLRDRLATISPKPAPGPTLRQVCSTTAFGLAQWGITSPADIAYSLTYLASGLSTTVDLLTCLVDRKYAYAAASLDHDRLFSGYPAYTKINMAEAENRYGGPEQPDYSQIRRTLATLTDWLPRYPVGKDNLDPLFAAAVKVDNLSDLSLPGLEEQTLPAAALVEGLQSAGFQRFGCFDQSTASDPDDAVGFFLMFKAARGDRTVIRANTYMVRPIFDENLKVARVVITDQPELIDPVVARRSQCGTLKIVAQ